MQSISAFLYITRATKFRGKNTDASRTQGTCSVIYMFLDLLQVSYNCAKFHHCRICVAVSMEGGLSPDGPPPTSSVSKPRKRPILNRVKTYTPVGSKFVFEKIKFKVLHYIQHDFIRQRSGLRTIRVACSVVLLLL